MAQTKTEEYNKWLAKPGNKEKVKERMKEWRKANRERLRISKLEYRSKPENRKKLNIAAKKWLRNHPEAAEKYKENAKCKVLTPYQRLMRTRNNSRYSLKPEVISLKRESFKQRIRTNTQCRLANRLRCNIYKCIKRERTTDSFCLKHTGCSKASLHNYLESKFQYGMLWSNYGMWEVDHIRSLSSYDLSDPNQYSAANHFSNLQPLWKMDNTLKGNKA